MLLLWLGGIFLAPIIKLFNPDIAEFLYYFYSPVCHQIPVRSFLLAGFPLAVCVRCVSFYGAGIIIIFFYLFRYRTGWWPPFVYIGLIAPFVIDIITEKAGFYTNFEMTRFFTGTLIGLVCFHLVIIGLSNRLKNDRKTV